ncbi:torsin-1A [Callorhinchus milii]|uniref:Torsin n=1 Tax=Callorhinchus milii TaxID=7868 RepID=A0A4W3JMR5_CALMI|nr:torsin-1A [Callorhinchus milii]|eukprot:gi/632964595/ref/XP_007898474.1/ PREDICTED: torsin-1A-like [Callorhinchus milii]
MKISGLLLFLLCPFPLLSEAVDPFRTFTLAGLAAAAQYHLYCRFRECCSEDWIPLDVKGLQEDLDNRLFGQHIASEVILKAIRGFLRNPEPAKPLVFSLHGSSGTGKNFISRIIAENLYKKGLNSNHVHQFLPKLNFPDLAHIDKYKQELQAIIQESVKACPRSLFIFDEMDKMHPEIINVIKPFLDYNDLVENVSYRKAMFIFLSNAGGEQITEFLLNVWKNGKKREEVQMIDLESTLTAEVYNKENSGFWRSNLIDNNLIDYFVPFLPLEYKHIKLCAKATLKARGFRTDEDTASQIADEMIYFPKKERLFSVKGCKTVSAKVDYFGEPK